jgi:hypothetical protein
MLHQPKIECSTGRASGSGCRSTTSHQLLGLLPPQTPSSHPADILFTAHVSNMTAGYCNLAWTPSIHGRRESRSPRAFYPWILTPDMLTRYQAIRFV